MMKAYSSQDCRGIRILSIVDSILYLLILNQIKTLSNVRLDSLILTCKEHFQFWNYTRSEKIVSLKVIVFFYCYIHVVCVYFLDRRDCPEGDYAEPLRRRQSAKWSMET